MNLDWNWYFSSFAQCGAALIGIIAAFIISKLLNESEKSDKIQNSLDEKKVTYKNLKSKINNCGFNWYNERTIEYSFEIKYAIREGKFDNLNDPDILQKLYEIEKTLYRDKRNLDYINERIKKLKPNKVKINHDMRKIQESIGYAASVIPKILDLDSPSDELRANLSKERETIEGLKIESETLIERFNLLKSEILSTGRKLIPINVTIYILSIGFLFTVIYPLHFMPLQLNCPPRIIWSFSVFINQLFTMKGILLIVLTTVIEGIFIYFLFLLISIKKKYKKLFNEIIKNFTEISGYSEYF